MVTPGIKQNPGDSKPLDSAVASQYRPLIVKLDYLAQDRADVQYAGKELARGMSPPTEADWQKLKRVGRHFVGRPRMVLKCRFQQYANAPSCMEDSDYAGCLKTRTSTNGGVITTA